jgi:hypothetical protein
MFFNSIRWRLQLWHGLVLVLVLAGFGFTAHQLDRISRFRRIDQELQQRVSVLTGVLRRGGPRGAGAAGMGPPGRAEPHFGVSQNRRPVEGEYWSLVPDGHSMARTKADFRHPLD